MKIKPSEADTQRAVLELLAAHKIYAGRLNTGGGRVDGRPVICHTFGKGCADILAFVRLRRVFWRGDREWGMDVRSVDGRFEINADSFVPVWIEVKAPGKKQRPEQVNFQQHVELLGHTYLLIDNVDQVAKWIKTL